MEQDRTHRLDTNPAADSASGNSLVDCLFEMMPETGAKRSPSSATSAVSAQVEARLAASIRRTIASRLGEDAA